MSKQPLIPRIGKKVHLADFDPAFHDDFENEKTANKRVEEDIVRLDALQDMLYAGGARSLLVVLQGIDTGGKDGTVRHVFRGLDPQGVHVASFKAPTADELAHDFLWRIHPHTPAKGRISIFNRSYYEDVLVPRVHKLVPKSVWEARYDQINQFESMLVANGTAILKFFLYISKDEQKRRLEDRLHDPQKQWKFSLDDLKERDYWDTYIEAYEGMLTRCNTEEAPWYIVPGNHKWYRNLVVANAVADTLDKMKLSYPKPKEALDAVVVAD